MTAMDISITVTDNAMPAMAIISPVELSRRVDLSGKWRAMKKDTDMDL